MATFTLTYSDGKEDNPASTRLMVDGPPEVTNLSDQGVHFHPAMNLGKEGPPPIDHLTLPTQTEQSTDLGEAGPPPIGGVAGQIISEKVENGLGDAGPPRLS